MVTATVDNLRCVIMQGKSGISQIEKFDTNGYSTRFAGEIKQLDVANYVNRKMARRLDDVIKYTIVAGKKVRTVLLATCPRHTHLHSLTCKQHLSQLSQAHSCAHLADLSMHKDNLQYR